ncbi:MAG: tetratricopeptide repeat protein [Cellvibrionaceae bacterium]|nr:tetratricopeptide repeat protein [Cellvibrionaceae bacterium]
MKRPIGVPLLILTLLVCACTSGHRQRATLIGPTLADIAEVNPALLVEQSAEQPAVQVSLDALEGYYQEALDAATDAGTRRTILIRLADILMLRSENTLLDAEQPGRYFDEAIARYQELIQLQRQALARGDDSDEMHQQIDQMLYQLSKAYALDGRVDTANKELEALTRDYADSIYTPEAKFRRAERAFSNADYREAQTLYKDVIEQGSFTPYYQNALYMLGWSQFKRADYEAAIAAFTKVLDNFYGVVAPIKTIPESQQNLVDDTLRVISLSFSYIDGARTLSEKFAGDTQRPYIHKLYLALGALYFEKQRYQDSADVYRQYVVDRPLSDFSPQFSRAIIDVYDKGDFPSLLVPAKQDYIVNYGIDSDYWAAKPPAVRERLKPSLKQYLQELAKFEHARAQALQAAGTKKGRQVLQDPKPHYLQAANWYKQFTRTFPNDQKTADMYFLMAEALNDAGELQQAYTTYRFLAYEYPLPESELAQGAEAGYAAILLAQRLAGQSARPEYQQLWHKHTIQQSLTFADKYTEDPRVASVLSEAAQKLLQTAQQPQAIQVARRVVDKQPAAAAVLRRSAWLVIAQSEFDLLNYASADDAYAQALALTAAADPERPSIIERRAASIYKLAETLLAQGENMLAVDQFLRIQGISPDTPIAITAHYDAGNVLLQAQQWQQAEAVLIDFRRRYPHHNLTKTLYAKFVVIYQETEQWRLAADELSAMAAVDHDPQLRRQSLLLAGDLYQKSGQTARALKHYTRYIARYPQPFDDRIEVLNKLAQTQLKNNNRSAHDYWLQQVIAAHEDAGDQQTQRSLYLAASALNSQAKKHFEQFLPLRLTLPLNKSLAVKRRALNKTVAAYQRLIAYGVAAYVTEANYYLGEIYARLSRDLLQSQRPPGLDALALEQYEILLEEQAYPFEEKAIALHLSNAARARKQLYDQWVKRSFAALAQLSPGRYNKVESQQVIRALY